MRPGSQVGKRVSVAGVVNVFQSTHTNRWLCRFTDPISPAEDGAAASRLIDEVDKHVECLWLHRNPDAVAAKLEC